MADSSIPSNIASITDYLRKGSIFEIIPAFLVEIRVLTDQFRCTPDKIFLNSRYNCSLLNNLIPLAITFGAFLLGILIIKCMINYRMKPTLTPAQRKQILKIKLSKKE